MIILIVFFSNKGNILIKYKASSQEQDMLDSEKSNKKIAVSVHKTQQHA